MTTAATKEEDPNPPASPPQGMAAPNPSMGNLFALFSLLFSLFGVFAGLFREELRRFFIDGGPLHPAVAIAFILLLAVALLGLFLIFRVEVVGWWRAAGVGANLKAWWSGSSKLHDVQAWWAHQRTRLAEDRRVRTAARSARRREVEARRLAAPVIRLRRLSIWTLFAWAVLGLSMIFLGFPNHCFVPLPFVPIWVARRGCKRIGFFRTISLYVLLYIAIFILGLIILLGGYFLLPYDIEQLIQSAAVR